MNAFYLNLRGLVISAGGGRHGETQVRSILANCCIIYALLAADHGFSTSNWPLRGMSSCVGSSIAGWFGPSLNDEVEASLVREI